MEAERMDVVDGCQVEQFEGGSIRVTAPPWALAGEGDLRVPLPLDLLFPGGPPRSFEASAREISGAFDEGEQRRLSAAQAAAFAALLWAAGIDPGELTLCDGAVGGYTRSGPRLQAGLPELLAAELGGQIAKVRMLLSAGDGSPVRLIAASMFFARSLALLPAFAHEPVALLYGEGARAPEDWSGRAVHMDHLWSAASAWIEQNAARIASLSEVMLERGTLDAVVVERVLGGAGPGDAVRRLPGDHLLRRPTVIAPEAIGVVADYWAETLSGGTLRGAQLDERQREERIKAFREALAELITSRIERREARGWVKIQRGRYHDDELRWPYSVGVRYEADAVLQDALTRADLDAGCLFGLLTTVEFDAGSVTAYRAAGGTQQAQVLWSACVGAGRE